MMMRKTKKPKVRREKFLDNSKTYTPNGPRECARRREQMNRIVGWGSPFLGPDNGGPMRSKE